MVDYTNIGAFASGALLAAAATWAARAVALHYGFVSRPNPLIPQHTRPIAYLGGLGIFVGGCGALGGLTWLDLPVSPTTGPSTWIVLLPALLYLILGLYDDWRALTPGRKFLWQSAIAALAAALGIRYPLTGFVVLDGAVAWFWILVLVNAVNLTDVCDGLAAGIAMLALLCAAQHDPLDARFVLCWSGTCLGFLLFNRPPATIFLGDAGSHLLGYILAAITLTGGRHQPAWPYAGAMMLIVGTFLFELVFITSVRVRKGLPWWRGSPDHFSLRLQAGGYSKGQTLCLAWAATAVLAGCALLVARGAPALQAGVLVGVLTLATLSWRMLLKWEVVRK